MEREREPIWSNEGSEAVRCEVEGGEPSSSEVCEGPERFSDEEPLEDRGKYGWSSRDLERTSAIMVAQGGGTERKTEVWVEVGVEIEGSLYNWTCSDILIAEQRSRVSILEEVENGRTTNTTIKAIPDQSVSLLA